MVGHVVPDPECGWTEREAELLEVALRLLQTHGYDRLTVDAVAAEAKASKATMYRRWPSKADLVLAAFIEGTRESAKAPNTGSLREDLIAIGTNVARQAREHTSTMRAVLNEMSHSAELRAAMQDKFVRHRQVLIEDVLAAAVTRGEIEQAAIIPEIWDVLPGYLVFRCLISERPPTEETVRILVDDVLLPSLRRA
ncbi:TetR/AcrR family transcriptional regulator [Mycolicibacterium sp. 018/SC-01/001]|uniref:TetR/AcrR family transcriptional regulator n=1 Tax=Mycolicibacterium sp. 018/SC-01/001 TaxID=2592069 RepID=UPI001180F16D|nr:TetR/AcrR family transcriptional regulator [Mycolicibacterium sp. 018/SC-01/001]TRW82113.1 TetR/AcrR family transcriptional regulator [Mycolicibacterium sp. 018/SC-01/001]